MTEVTSWLDERGFRRCNATPRTKAPRTATVIAMDGEVSILGRVHQAFLAGYREGVPVFKVWISP